MRQDDSLPAMRRHTLCLVLLLSAVCACGGDGNAPPEEGTAASAPAPDTAAQAPSDAPVGTISSRGEMVADSSAGAGGAPEGSIEFDMPSSWENQPPSSSMRLAQATIPGPGGPGDFAVFFFGPGGGGGVADNIERWIGQMETTDRPEPETFEGGGLKVTWIDVAGTLKASQMGMGPSTPQADSRLYGAVVEGPGGPWFFKATGPEATLAPQREAFVTMLKSVRPR